MIELYLKDYNPVNDLFLLETDTPKVNKSDFDESSTGIILQRKSIIDSRKILGKIVKKGPNTPDTYNIGDVINFYPDAGLDIEFKDANNKYLLIGEEKFLGIIKKEDIHE